MKQINPLFLTKGLAFVAAFIIYLLNLIFPSTVMQIILNGTAMVLFFTALLGVARFYFRMAVGFLISSIIITIVQGVSLYDVLSGFSTMVKLILFIGLIPLISAPIQPYLQALQQIIKALTQRISPYRVCHLSAFILSNIINMAALPITKTIFFQEGAKEDGEAKAELSLRAFGLAMMITPIGAAIALAIDITGTKWIQLLSINIFLVGIGLILSNLISKKNRMETGLTYMSEIAETPKQDYRVLAAIGLPFGFYFLFLLLSEDYFSIGMMETILISVLPFTFFWSLTIKKINEWWDTCRIQIFRITPNFFGQFAVIISAGLLIHTIELTQLNQQFFDVLPGVDTRASSLIYIPFTILFVLTLSMLGVHQFVAMIFVSQIISPEMLGIAPIIFASALMVGFTSGMLASAFSGATITMSGLLQSTSSHGVARKNYPFVFIFMMISMLILIVLNYFVR